MVSRFKIPALWTQIISRVYKLNKMAEFCEAFKRMCETFNIAELNVYQREAISQFARRNMDVFVIYPLVMANLIN